MRSKVINNLNSEHHNNKNKANSSILFIVIAFVLLPILLIEIYLMTPSSQPTSFISFDLIFPLILILLILIGTWKLYHLTKNLHKFTEKILNTATTKVFFILESLAVGIYVVLGVILTTFAFFTPSIPFWTLLILLISILLYVIPITQIAIIIVIIFFKIIYSIFKK